MCTMHFRQVPQQMPDSNFVPTIFKSLIVLAVGGSSPSKTPVTVVTPVTVTSPFH